MLVWKHCKHRRCAGGIQHRSSCHFGAPTTRGIQSGRPSPNIRLFCRRTVTKQVLDSRSQRTCDRQRRCNGRNQPPPFNRGHRRPRYTRAGRELDLCQAKYRPLLAKSVAWCLARCHDRDIIRHFPATSNREIAITKQIVSRTNSTNNPREFHSLNGNVGRSLHPS